jgi:hypothetical protein
MKLERSLFLHGPAPSNTLLTETNPHGQLSLTGCYFPEPSINRY